MHTVGGYNWVFVLSCLDHSKAEGEEIEYGYPITCGDSRAVLLFKKFVCPGINVRCVKVSRFVFAWSKGGELAVYKWCCETFLSQHRWLLSRVVRHICLILHINTLSFSYSSTTSSSVLSSLYTWQGKPLWRTGKGPSDLEGLCLGRNMKTA